MKKLALFLFISFFLSSNFSKLHANNIKKVELGNTFALSRSLSSDETYDHSGMVFVGNLIEKNLINSPGIKKLELKFRVESVLKGIEEGTEELTLYQWAGLNSPLNDLSPNRHMFCFYTPSPKTGLTSLVGSEQGLLRL
ncbi:MAG: hypothetical protein HRT47_04660 [Candidatus Caenarcaniphilales bacterium]|nr:hypothetical protein [Candidatus Caenarcaniphilales bacterium]